jgi:hypothetical protein
MKNKSIEAHGIRLETDQVGRWALENAKPLSGITTREEMTIAMLAQLHAALKGQDLPYDQNKLLLQQCKVK